MPKYKPKSHKILVLTQEERLSVQRQHDVLLLLQHLAEREETTVKLILDRLYDFGAANLIDNKLGSRSLKKLTKVAAKVSKPAFGVIALYWFKQNCPQLIADWLIKQVAFENKQTTATEIVKVDSNELQLAEPNSLEIRQLRSQVRLLTNILITVIALCGGSFAWLFYSPQVQPSSWMQPAKIPNTLVQN